MKHSDVIYGQVSSDKIEINKNELALRLKVDRNFNEKVVDECKDAFLNEVCYRYAYVKAPVKINDNCCDFGFMKAFSHNLCKELNGCSHAYILAVTTGIGVDRLLLRLNAVSNSKHFITDAVGSAAVESFCDYIDDEINKIDKCRPRFSPGYGDLSIELQKPLLQRLDAQATVGITLNSSFLMSPVKSITAILGVE